MKNGDIEKIHLLLVEDHAVVREGIRDLIGRQQDMEVVGEVDNGADATALAVKLKPDVVLMDIALPGMNGVEATRAIKRAMPDTHILVLTAYDSEEFVVAILDAGASGYLLKNVRGKELVSAIRTVHAGESVLHPAVAKQVLMRAQQLRHADAAEEAGPRLSERELQVVNLGASGLINKEIADKLALGDRTIQTHWRNVFNKLGVNSRMEAVMLCIKKGWIDATALSGNLRPE